MTKEIYYKRKESGLYVSCGKVQAGSVSVKCEPCRLRDNAITWINRKENVEQGLCSVCSNTRLTHQTLCNHHLEKRRAISSSINRKLKVEVLTAYGGLVCACCGEREVTFLTIDHVNNDGWKERKTEGRIRYVAYTKLKKQGFPNDPPLQVLCYNCNNGKRVNRGVCPHQEKQASNAT